MKNFRERRVQINFPELDGLTLKKLFRMLRFTTFIFFLSLMQVMAIDSYAQMAKLSLSVENQRLENVLGTIEDESEFFFLYNKDLIDVEQEVSIDARYGNISIRNTADSFYISGTATGRLPALEKKTLSTCKFLVIQ